MFFDRTWHGGTWHFHEFGKNYVTDFCLSCAKDYLGKLSAGFVFEMGHGVESYVAVNIGLWLAGVGADD